MDNASISNNLFANGGEMGTLMRSIDWASTPLGSVATWSQSLCTSVSICLQSRFPILIWWGRELVMLYNDAYRQNLAICIHKRWDSVEKIAGEKFGM